MGNGRTVVGVVLIIIGLIGLVVGVMYLAVPAHSLPSFMPGHIAGKAGNVKHSKRGTAGVAVGAVVLIVGIVLVATRRSHRY